LSSPLHLTPLFVTATELYSKVRAQEGIQQYQLASVFNKAYMKVIEIKEKIRHRLFRCLPFNPAMFTEIFCSK
jgi:hypothetical protein